MKALQSLCNSETRHVGQTAIGNIKTTTPGNCRCMPHFSKYTNLSLEQLHLDILLKFKVI